MIIWCVVLVGFLRVLADTRQCEVRPIHTKKFVDDKLNSGDVDNVDEYASFVVIRTRLINALLAWALSTTTLCHIQPGLLINGNTYL